MKSCPHLWPAAALVVLILLLNPGAAAAIDPCDAGLCDCYSANIVDLATYFVPNYPGWSTAKKIWLSADGGTSHGRFFSYAPNKYELIKFQNNASTETYTVTSSAIYLTAENNINNSSTTRTYPAPYAALDWMPRYACNNKPLLNQYDVCHGGEHYYQNCVFQYSNPSHCGIFKSKIIFYYGYNYGYNVGVVDTIVKVDKLDDGAQEKYYYGKNKGFLRWEYINPSGVMTNWGQQIGEEPNSPLYHAACFQP